MIQRKSAAPVSLIVALVLAVGVVVARQTPGQSQGGTPPPAGAQAQAPEQPPAHPAEDVYMNIQVFKGVPAWQIVPTMNFMAASLGVQCNFCHVSLDAAGLAKDDKETKQTARKMITMTLAINKDNFNGRKQVTCNSCHNGHHEPTAVPLVASERPAPAPPPPPPATANTPSTPPPTVDQILAKYVEALGGQSTLEKLTSRVGRGTLSVGDFHAPFELYQEAPGKQLALIHLPNGERAQGFDGTTMWESGPGASEEPSEAWQLARAKRSADLQSALHMKQAFPRLQVFPRKDKMGDHEAYVVMARPQGDTPVRFYFDAESGLLLRTTTVLDTPLGLSPTQTDYEDYRAVDGVQVPFRIRQSRLDNTVILQFDDVKQNVPVDDAKFTKPAGK